MASSSELSDSAVSAAAKSTTEKSMFTQTCTLLREYIKEKGPLGDLTLGMNLGLDGNAASESLRPSSTINLFPVPEKPPGVSSVNVVVPRNPQSINLFPQEAGFGTSASKEDFQRMADYRVNKPVVAEPGKAQMTIFYAGQVLVFNDFPADKAEEVMRLASMGRAEKPSCLSSDLHKNPIDPAGTISSCSSASPNFGKKLMPDRNQQPHQTGVSDLPIARKASLARFLEKRKDRITSKAPYNLGSQLASPPVPKESSKAWLRLAAESSELFEPKISSC